MARSSASSTAHSFGRTRPSDSGAFHLHTTPKRNTKYRELPTPTGEPPFHLDLGSVVPPASIQAMTKAKRMTFHVNGDVGGIRYNVPQQLVARGMEADFQAQASASQNPAFLYLVGDCVYFNGEVKEYFPQFYEPYEFYRAPIFAVPGNHDGENMDNEDSLKGFTRNFCARVAVKMPEAGDSQRTAMTQPNVYWTLVTPLANFVGLYSNVPEGGEIKAPQTVWLRDQLKKLPKTKPLIVTLHHPIYSADDHHSGSTHMKVVLEEAVEAAGGRHPDLVIAGHVHNYQRLTKAMPGGTQIPYLVVGAGGYHNLHQVRKVDGHKMIPPVRFEDAQGDAVTLERYSDDHHGFLRMEITDRLVIGRYFEVPRPQEPYSKGSRLADHFEYDWKKHKYVPNHL